MVLPVAAALLACAAALVASAGVPPRVDAPAGMGALGAWVRRIGPIAAYLERERLQDRRRACLLQLPVLLDVLTLGLAAGLSFDASLELYCARYANELSEALAESMMSWRMGVTTRSAALSQLARRLDVDALKRFSSAVIEALAFGSPLADVLEHQAQAIRDEHRSHVEEAIEKVPVKMLIPLGTLIVPAMLLAILGPLVGPALQTV